MPILLVRGYVCICESSSAPHHQQHQLEQSVASSLAADPNRCRGERDRDDVEGMTLVACAATILLRVALTAAGGMSQHRLQADRETPSERRPEDVENTLRMPLPQLLSRKLKNSLQLRMDPVQLIFDDDADDAIVLNDGSVWKPYQEIHEVRLQLLTNELCARPARFKSRQ